LIIAKNTVKKTDFELSINHNVINLRNVIKYLGVHLDNKLTWKPHIDILYEKLSKACGMICAKTKTYIS